MKTNLKFLFFISGGLMTMLIFTFINCEEPCLGYDTHHYPLCSDTLKIPYNGDDSLIFLRMSPSDTDTIVYIGQGKSYFNYKEYILHEGKSNCDEEFIYDGYAINFTSDKSPDNIWFKIQMFTDKSSEFYIRYKGREFHDIPSMVIGVKSYGGYLGTFSFEGMNFLDLSFLIREFNGNDEKLYINLQNGIVRFEFKDFILQLLK